MVAFVDESEWLVKAADLRPGESLSFTARRPITYMEMQKALDAQYGPGIYAANAHGNNRVVNRWMNT